jgi:hypothetical protein
MKSVRTTIIRQKKIIRQSNSIQNRQHTTPNSAVFSAFPSPGFCPEISGFFKAVGIFLGFLFLKVNLGILLGFFEKGKFEI